MTDYPETGRAALDLADAIATDTATVRRGESKGLNAREIRSLMERMTGVVPEDDEIPPVAPTGFMVTPGMRLLLVSWDEPPETDYVTQARVRTYRESNDELVLTQFIRGRSVTIPSLDPYQPDGTTRESYNVEVALIDMWGRIGEAASTGAHMPDLTAADAVDLQKLSQLQLIQGLLPNENLATIEDAILLGNGVVQARSMTSMDAAAINLWVQNAAIEAAKVKEMTVDKLVGGMISTTTISVASRMDLIGSGTLNAGQLQIGANGITLGELGSNIGFPSSNPASWLTPRLTPLSPPSPFAGLSFFSTTSGTASRGVAFNADGIAGTPRIGMFRFCATNGNQLNDSFPTAILTINSGSALSEPGFVGIKENLNVNRDLTVYNDLLVFPTGRLRAQSFLESSVPASSTLQPFHNLTDAPRYVIAQYAAAGYWWPFSDNQAGMRLYVDGNRLYVQNNNTTVRNVRIQILR